MTVARALLVVVLLPALSPTLAGCTGLLDWSNAATATVTWRKSGFSVEDKRREWTFDADEGRETLEFDGQITYVDLNLDGKVDSYARRLGGKKLGKWTRNEPGSEDLFAKADLAFADARSMLAVEGHRKTWSEMSAEERAAGHGFGARER